VRVYLGGESRREEAKRTTASGDGDNKSGDAESARVRALFARSLSSTDMCVRVCVGGMCKDVMWKLWIP
jgi:hypothetical protein